MKEIYNQETGELTYTEEVILKGGAKCVIYFPKPFDSSYHVAITSKQGVGVWSKSSTQVELINASDEERHAEVVISNHPMFFPDLMRKE